MRSASGDFKKDKIRLRWYGDGESCCDEVPVFLERKSREGFASSKQRRRMLVPAQSLEQNRLGAGIISRTVLASTLAEFGLFPEQPLSTVIVISYWRYRFNEMLTGMRVSLDLNIRSTLLQPGLGYAEGEIWLPGGVVEIKGPTLETPPTLRRIKLLETDWSRFSKYAHCLEAHMQDPGSIGRLWPSGRLAIT